MINCRTCVFVASQLQSLLQSSDVSPQHLFELLQGSGMLAGGGGAGLAGGLSPMDFLTGGLAMK